MKAAALIILTLIVATANAAEPTNIALGRTYTRVKGNDKELCPKTVRPALDRSQEGAPVLNISPRIGFAWASLTEAPERFDGCTLHSSQTLDDKGQITILTQKTLADCEKPNPQLTSAIATLTLKGEEIEYESVPQVKSKITGRWITDESKKPTSCRYTLK